MCTTLPHKTSMNRSRAAGSELNFHWSTASVHIVDCGTNLPHFLIVSEDARQSFLGTLGSLDISRGLTLHVEAQHTPGGENTWKTTWPLNSACLRKMGVTAAIATKP